MPYNYGLKYQSPLTRQDLSAPLPDLNITKTTTISTRIMEVIKSQKGGLKIMYAKMYARKTAIGWECSNRIALSCKADITTGLEMKTVTISTPHTLDSYDTAVSATVELSLSFSLTQNRVPRK